MLISWPNADSCLHLQGFWMGWTGTWRGSSTSHPRLPEGDACEEVASQGGMTDLQHSRAITLRQQKLKDLQQRIMRRAALGLLSACTQQTCCV